MNDDDDSAVDYDEDTTSYYTSSKRLVDIWDSLASTNIVARKSLIDMIDDTAKSKPAPNYKKIADAVMRELVANGIEDMILIKNDDVREWWSSVVAEEKRIAKAKEDAEKARAKKIADAKALKALMDRLTPEEKRLLKLKE